MYSLRCLNSRFQFIRATLYIGIGAFVLSPKSRELVSLSLSLSLMAWFVKFRSTSFLLRRVVVVGSKIKLHTARESDAKLYKARARQLCIADNNYLLEIYARICVYKKVRVYLTFSLKTHGAYSIADDLLVLADIINVYSDVISRELR